MKLLPSGRLPTGTSIFGQLQLSALGLVPLELLQRPLQIRTTREAYQTATGAFKYTKYQKQPTIY